MRRGIAASPLATYSAGVIQGRSAAGLGNRLFVESFNKDKPFSPDAPSVAVDYFFDQRPEVGAVAGWRLVSAAASTVSSTQDFTVGGIGTPVAAIVIMTGATGFAGTPIADSVRSIGIKTGSFEGGICGINQDNVADSVCKRAGFTNALVKMPTSSSTYDAVATGSLIADGIRLTWSTQPASGRMVHVILFFGPDLQAQAAQIVPVGAQLVSTSWAPDAVFCLSAIDSFDDTLRADDTMYAFLGVRNGGVNYPYASNSPDAQATSLAQMITDNPNVIASAIQENTSPPFLFGTPTNFASWASDGFNISGSGTPPFIYLALRFGGKQVYASINSTPGIAAEATYTGSGMFPAYGFNLQSRLGTWPSNNKTARGGAFGFSAFNQAGEQFAAAWANQDAQATMNTASYSYTAAYALPTDAAADENIANFSSFAQNKFSWEFSAAVLGQKFVTLLVERDWHTATGTPSFPIPTASATGALKFIAAVTGSPAGQPKFPLAQGSGVGTLEFTGTGAGTFPLATGAASGTLEFSATGAGSFAVPTGTGAGSLEFSGSGAGTFPLAQGTGVGTLEFTGTGAGTFPLVQGSSTGALIFESTTADGVFPLASGESAGALIFEATGTGFFPLPTAEGTGTVTTTGDLFIGAGEGSFPLPTSFSSGLLVFTGTVDAFFPLALGSGFGAQDPLGCIVDLDGSYDGVSPLNGSYKTISLLNGSRKVVSLLEGSYSLASELEGSYDLLTDLDGGVC